MSGTDPEPRSAPHSGRGAVVISQTYYHVVAAVGLVLLLAGAIEALIALRRWVLPLSETVESSGVFGGSADSNETARSFLGALAVATPGALVLWWHLREARRREAGLEPRASWSGVLYFHLVALVSLLIALGGVVAMLHALRDSVLPFCYDDTRTLETAPTEEPSVGAGFEATGSPIVIPLPSVPPTLIRSEPECYPSTPEALRSALDGGIVASVAGAAWLWHLRRGRRALEPPAEG